MKEQTLSIIKPDAVERNLINNIKSVFEKNNLKIIKEKKVKITKKEAEDFYKVHQTKSFYNELCDFMTSGPIVVQILEGDNAIELYRQTMGATNPEEADANTIRKKFASSIQENAVHGSDSEENAVKEIEFFFKNS